MEDCFCLMLDIIQCFMQDSNAGAVPEGGARPAPPWARGKWARRGEKGEKKGREGAKKRGGGVKKEKKVRGWGEKRGGKGRKREKSGV